MYDEPFAGLDPISGRRSAQLIRQAERRAGHHARCVVTHDIYESLKIVDYLYFVSEGRIVAQRHRRTRCARRPTPFVRQFVDGQPDGPVPFHYPRAGVSRELLTRVG